MAPSKPCLVGVILLKNPHSWVWAGPRLQKTRASVLLLLFLLSLSLSQSTCYGISGLMERPKWQGTEGDLQPRISKQLRSWSLRVAGSFQWPHDWALKPTVSPSSLQMRPQPWITPWLQSCERREIEVPSYAVTKFQIHRNCEIMFLKHYMSVL